MLEAWLVWVYRNFDVPPAGGGGPTLRAARLPVEADTLQKARKAVTLDKAPKSKLGLLRADPKGPCQGGCPEHALNRAGSNAHVMKTTCMGTGPLSHDLSSRRSRILTLVSTRGPITGIPRGQCTGRFASTVAP